MADSGFSWSDAPEDPHSLAHRRHSAREADDWGLAGDDSWVVNRVRTAERSLAARDRVRLQRAMSAADDGFDADSWEEQENGWAGSLAPDGDAAGHFAGEHHSAYDWAREFDSGFDQVSAEPIRARRIAPDSAEPERAESDRIEPDWSEPDPPEPARDETPGIELAAVREASQGSDDIWEERPSATGQRRTVVITGRGDDYGFRPRGRGWEASLPAYERSTFKPDRVAVWAVLLGIILLLVATATSHAAVIAAHLAH